MVRTKRCVAAIATAWLFLSSVPSDARLPNFDQRSVPPAPPAEYDPISGPFLARIGRKGELDDPGVIANATASWNGPNLSAFVLCFQPGADRDGWQVAFEALHNVSVELKMQGAVTVVIDGKRICDAAPSPSMGSKPHVEIKGVIRG